MNRLIEYVFMLLLASTPALAMSASPEVNFVCKGITEGDLVKASSEEFSLSVNPQTGQLYGMPAYIAAGCMEGMNGEKPKVSISLEDKEAVLKCENWYATTTARLNRITLQFSTTHVIKENKATKTKSHMVFGKYNCTTQKEKAF